MRTTHIFSIATLAGALMLPLGCGSGDTGAMEELSPDDQAEIESIRESYNDTGRYGPGGQNAPSQDAPSEDGAETAPQ